MASQTLRARRIAARRRVYDAVAAIVWGHIYQGAEYLAGEDADLLIEAAERLALRLHRQSLPLGALNTEVTK